MQSQTKLCSVARPSKLLDVWVVLALPKNCYACYARHSKNQEISEEIVIIKKGQLVEIVPS